jgi:hypothetical protein
MQTTTTIVALCAGTACGQLSFVDATADLGLADLAGPHCCFVDLNNDARPDAVVGRNRVFLNASDADASRGLRFVEVGASGLPAFRTGDIAVFADLDNDGNKDCVWTRYLDIHADNYEPPTDGPPKTAWLRGNGDGTFGSPLGAWEVIDAAQEATTAAVAVGDVDADGRLDIYLGNWYRKYGADHEGIPNLLLKSARGSVAVLSWFRDTRSPAVAEPFNDDTDPGGRPTYGVVIARGLVTDGRDSYPGLPQLLDLNYGRRWNRLWRAVAGRPGFEHDYGWTDTAPDLGLDGDDIRHGRYPEWLKERAKADPRFDREDELPFRANGNTFDAAVGDIDNDGDFDLFLAEITHAWAGESSDRSRFLVQERDEHGAVRFASKPELSVDRAPTDPTIQSWNQGDIYAELADFDLDGRLDLLLCSSDYPDNQRLRIYSQQLDGSFSDITSWIGIDHLGAGQPSIADIDADGDLDIMVGQSFNRLGADQTTGREPRVRVYLNQAADKALGKAITLRLVGDPTPRDADRPEDRLTAVSRDALGAIVRMTAVIHGERVTQSRQLIGIGGHQGKQMDFALHFGLGDAAEAERIEIEWPSRAHQATVLEHVEPGTHEVHLAGDATGD